MTIRFSLRLAAMFALILVSGTVSPARADPEPSPSLDGRLRKGLGAVPIDEIDRELFAPEAMEAEKRALQWGQQHTQDKEGDELREQLLRELGAAAESEDENPLLGIARGMRQAEDLIAQTESGPRTQDLQKEIVADLDALIEQARSRSKKCSPSQSTSKVAVRRPVRQPKKEPSPAGAKPSEKPVADPAAKPGSAEADDLSTAEREQLIKSVWGELPETEREQMLEWAGQEFLPKYELLIEQYFKRLVEEGQGRE